MGFHKTLTGAVASDPPARPKRRFDPMATTVLQPQPAVIIGQPGAQTLDRMRVVEEPSAPRAPRLRPSRRQLCLLGAALAGALALVSFALSFAPERPTPHVVKPAASQPAKPVEPVAVPPPAAAADIAVDTVTPAEAARAFALGDEAGALELYRRLARAHPDERAYPVMVGVLSARTKEH